MNQRDASLLFGVFAVQFKKITPQQLHEVAAQWQQDPSRELSQMLVESGYLTEDDYNHIRRLVDDARAAHAGDSSAALQTFGGQRMIDATYRDAITLSQDEIRTVPMPEGAIPGVPLDNIDAVDETPGRYTNQSEYARGGIGRVLLVHDQHLGREIAMKELLPFVDYVDESMKLEKSPVRQSMALVTRFLQEARVTGQLEHPSIVPVYELGRRRDGTLYYTMKLVRGRTLAAAIREAGTLPNRLALLSHFVDLCQAIAYSHSRRVIHRDIKPSNVMVGKFGETVVLDWGLAKVKDKTDDAASQMEETLKTLRLPAAKGHETHAGQVLGTPAYMSPEQAAGQIERIDERSDVYSLGAVLYTLLTGKYPYDGDNASEILNRLLVGPPRPVLEVEPNAPPELAAICDRAMQREAEKRYNNAKDLADDVIRFQTGALVLAHSYKFSDHLKRFVQHHKPALATAALFTVALAAFAVYSYIRVTDERNDAIAARNEAITARDSEAEQRQRADDARDAEAEQRRLSESLLYSSQIGFAQSQIDAKRFDLAQAALDAAPKDFRGWEWDYLNGLCNQDIYTFAPGERGLYAIAVSADGSMIAVGGHSGVAYVVDAKSGELRQKLDRHRSSISAIAFNPSATRVLTTSSDKSASIWNLVTGERLFALADNSSPWVDFCAFTSDDRYAITISIEGRVSMWSASDGKLAHVFQADSQIRIAAMDSQNRRVVVGNDNGKVVVYDINSRLEEFSADTPSYLTAVGFSPSGDILTAGNSSGEIYVWKNYLSPPTKLLGHAQGINSIAFIPNGERIISASPDGSARIWDSQSLNLLQDIRPVENGVVSRIWPGLTPTSVLMVASDRTTKILDIASAEVVEYAGHSAAINNAHKLQDNRIATTADDGTLKTWPVGEEFRKRTVHLRGHTGPIAQIDFSSFGDKVLTLQRRLLGAAAFTSPDSTARVWDCRSGLQRSMIEIENETIVDVAWSPDANTIAVVLNDKTALLLDTASGKEVHRLSGHTAAVVSATFSPDGSLVLTTSKDKAAILWRTADGKSVFSLSGHNEEVFGGIFSPDGSRVATYGKRRELHVYETATGRLLKSLVAHDVRINALRFLNDNVRLISAGGDGRVILWDTSSGDEIRRFEGHTEAVWDLTVSPDEKFLATASDDATVRICDVETGKLLHICTGHSGTVWGVAYSPDGSRLASCGDDATVRLWDTASGRERITFREHTGEVNDVKFSPDGRILASASADSSAILRSINDVK